jgi:hypothetical protein
LVVVVVEHFDSWHPEILLRMVPNIQSFCALSLFIFNYFEVNLNFAIWYCTQKISKGPRNFLHYYLKNTNLTYIWNFKDYFRNQIDVCVCCRHQTVNLAFILSLPIFSFLLLGLDWNGGRWGSQFRRLRFRIQSCSWFIKCQRDEANSIWSNSVYDIRFLLPTIMYIMLGIRFDRKIVCVCLLVCDKLHWSMDLY